jgi:hypothetical protein
MMSFKIIVFSVIIAACVVGTINNIKQREQIIALQAAKRSQAVRIELLENNVNLLTEGFFDEYELTDEQVRYIIQTKKWGRKKQ